MQHNLRLRNSEVTNARRYINFINNIIIVVVVVVVVVIVI